MHPSYLLKTAQVAKLHSYPDNQSTATQYFPTDMQHMPCILQAAAQHGGATTQRLPAHGAGASSQVHKRQHRLSTSPGQQHPQIASSGGIRTHTPEMEDVSSAALRKRVRRTTVLAPVPDSTAAALHSSAQQPGMATNNKSFADTAAAAEAAAVPAALQDTAWTSLQPPPATPNAVAPAREAFSLGVMWDAYHSNPTEGMPGYPRGFWASEPSPFAALAAVPLQEEDSSCNKVAMLLKMPSTSSSW